MQLSVPTLTTDRLAVRPFEPGDLAAIHRIIDGDAFSAQPGAPPAPGSYERRARWLEWTILSYAQLAELYQPPYGDRAIVLREGGELIGQVGYVPSYMPFGQLGAPFDGPPMAHSPEVGLFWAVATPHRGRGYAGEAARALIGFAFEKLQLRRIVATTEHDNHASQAVMRKLGMRLLRNPLPGPAWLQVVGVLSPSPVDVSIADSR